MKAPEWYAAWREEAFRDLKAKQDQLSEVYQLGTWPRYDYDLQAATLTFSNGGDRKVVADMQAVGTTGTHDWLWSWGNSHLPITASEALTQVRAFGAENKIEELTSASVKNRDLEALGWSLTAVSVRVLGGVGAYRAPSKAGSLFLILRSLQVVN